MNPEQLLRVLHFGYPSRQARQLLLSYRSLLDETGAPIGVQQKLMRHAKASTTMNVYGYSTLKAKQEANSKVVQMVMRQEAGPLLETWSWTERTPESIIEPPEPSWNEEAGPPIFRSLGRKLRQPHRTRTRDLGCDRSAQACR
jgi:hypothetical protein